MDRKRIDQAAAQAGIAADFINAHGKRQAIEPETKRKLLAAMNRADGAQEGAASPLPAVKVFYQGAPLALTPAGEGEYLWALQREDGECLQGRVGARKTLTLPGDLPMGYHQLTLSQGEQQWSCRVIVAPRRCFEPDALLTGKKLWGACVQLYTLRSDRNWGIGDFGDLRLMVEQVGERGGAFVGLNPIHALYPANPESASPYSPSSRRWLNLAYIDVNAVEDFQRSDAAQRWWQKPATQKQLAKARAAEWVDYTAVMQLKLAALKLAFPLFQARQPNDAQRQAFEQFVAEGATACISRRRLMRCMPIWRPKTPASGAGRPGPSAIGRGRAMRCGSSAPNIRTRSAFTCGCNGWRPRSSHSVLTRAGSSRCRLACIAIWRSGWRKAGRKPGVTVSCTA